MHKLEENGLNNNWQHIKQWFTWLLLKKHLQEVLFVLVFDWYWELNMTYLRSAIYAQKTDKLQQVWDIFQAKMPNVSCLTCVIVN